MTQLTRRNLLGSAVAASAATALSPFGIAPAQAAAPPVGKQAPGFYRYKVGSIEVTAVTDGLRPTALADNFVRNASKEALHAAVAAGYEDPTKASFPFTPIVVNTGPKLVVIDTGLGPATFQQSKGALGQFQTNLAASGIDPKAVDIVIISHFHGDHINGLVGADNKPLFENAEVMVPAPEWSFWMDDGNLSRAPEAMKGAFNNARRVFGALGNKVTRYEGGKELTPGISSVATPGHTPGHTSYVISSGSATVMVQVDVTAGPALLFVRNPDWQAAFDVDGPKAVETRRKLYDQVVADKMLLQGFHFPFPSVGRLEKDGAGYRWVPAPWNPTI